MWKRIDEPYIWGYRAIINGKTFDVVRYYQGEWHINYTEQKFTTLSTAKRIARQMASQ